MNASSRFRFSLLEDLSEAKLVAIAAERSEGEAIIVWAEIDLDGRTAILRQPFISGFDAVRRRDMQGRLGLQGIRQLAQDAMEHFDVDCIGIEQARRISGAHPGRAVDDLVFRRRP